MDKHSPQLNDLLAQRQLRVEEVRQAEREVLAAQARFKRAKNKLDGLEETICNLHGKEAESCFKVNPFELGPYTNKRLPDAIFDIVAQRKENGASLKEIHLALLEGGFKRVSAHFATVLHVTCSRLVKHKIFRSVGAYRSRRFIIDPEPPEYLTVMKEGKPM